LDALLPRTKPDNDPPSPQSPPSTPSPTEAEYRALLSSPKVRAFLERRVRPLDISADDKSNLVDGVLEALWERRDRNPPPTLPRLLGLARCIVKRRIASYCRHDARTRERFVDAKRVAVTSPEDGDSAPAVGDDPAEQPNYVDSILPLRSLTPEAAALVREKLRFVQEIAPRIGMTDDDVEVMWALTYDPARDRMEELAAERGVTPKGLRSRIERLQKAIEEGWEKRMKRRLLLTLLLLALLAFVLAAVGAGRRTPPPPPDTLPELRTHELAPPPAVPHPVAQPAPPPFADGKPPAK
ncbi:MAG TPA: hypothetical protein VIY73_20650, partial [Polyangiaceae bacterium]